MSKEITKLLQFPVVLLKRYPNRRDVGWVSLLNIQGQNFAPNCAGWDLDVSPMTLIMLSLVLGILKEKNREFHTDVFLSSCSSNRVVLQESVLKFKR